MSHCVPHADEPSVAEGTERMSEKIVSVAKIGRAICSKGGSPAHVPDRPQVERPKDTTPIVCPTCKRSLRVPAMEAADRPRFFPFCSERCRLIDLNAWLDADYRIVARPDEESEDALAGDESPS